MSSPYPVEPVRPRLWRSTRHKALAGVCGGLAEKFKVDPAFMRLIYVAFTMFSGVLPGTVLYLIVWSITREHDVT